MTIRLWPAIGLAAALTACAATSAPQQAAVPAAPLPSFDISYRKDILPNGLTLIVHEDHKAPVVAVNVWYHVGSKDEPRGKTGFAHLFEHLMFNGSEHYRDEFFKPFEQVGATNMNGTTWLDRTNYFQDVPTTALDMALWMESDRMGHLLGAIDQKVLDEQRGVVQNEKRQGENEPYGRVFEQIQRASFPEGHPYRWTTIGSMEDLNAASLEDVKQWFERYYGAANVTLVIAGDIDFETAREKVLQYFGDIPAGPPLLHAQTWVAARDESTRDLMFDRVAQTRVHRAWNVPPFGSAEAVELELVARILGGGKTSRLYERLVYRDRLASSANAFLLPFELASLFGLQVDLHDGVAAAQVESILAEELQRLLREGPTAAEVQRAQTSYVAELVRGAERIGGFGGKSDLLATCEVYTGNPGCTSEALATVRAATPASLQAVAQRWLGRGDYTLTVEPYPEYETVETAVDRSAGPPTVQHFPELDFPALQRATLSNGLEIVLAERHAVPVVEMSMQFEAGFASDVGGKLGTSSFTMAMLDEGTQTLDALQIAARLEELGAQFSASSDLDTSQVALSALKPRMAASLALYADILRHPAFRESDIERLRAQWLAGIAQEKTDPTSLAMRVLPPLLYGEGHAYSMPLTGSGTEASIAALTAADLRAYHQRWLRPDMAELIVVGDTTLAELVPELERVFGDWRPPGVAKPEKNIPTVSVARAPRLFLLDRPGAPQSVVIAGLVAPSSKVENHLQIETMNAIFGGTFTSRLNMNLREDKHWSYGARSLLPSAVGQRPFLMYAPVQTDKTAESVQEMLQEARAYVGSEPATQEEVDKIKARNVRSLPGRYETAGAILATISEMLLLDRPDNYVELLKPRLEAQTVPQVRAAAAEVIAPEALTWVVVGDLSKIEAPLRALELGEAAVIDADGRPLR